MSDASQDNSQQLSQQQRAYLKAMGVQVWMPRDLAEAEEVAAVGNVAAVNVEAKVGTVAETKSPVAAVSEMPAPQITKPGAGHRLAEIEAILGSGSAASSKRAKPVVDRKPEASTVRQPGEDTRECERLDWKGLQSRARSCTSCDLHTGRTHSVFGVGSQQADWLIIGDAPGMEEDKQGEPLVGEVGDLLNNMLLAIGLKREQVYITDTLKCRPPNDRAPRPDEVTLCDAFLKRQIQLLQPKLILAVGRLAAQNILQTGASLGELRGKAHFYDCAGDVGNGGGAEKQGTTQIPVIVTYHPSYLQSQPQEKRKAWQDLQFAQKYFSGLMP